MTRTRGEVVMTSAGDLIAVRPQRFNLPVWLVAIGLMLRWTARAVWWCLRHPRTTGLTAGTVWLYIEYDWPGPTIPAVLVGIGAGMWRWRHPVSWWRWFGGPLLGHWRRIAVYRRIWHESMVLC